MTAPRAQPLYLGPEERPLFGWLHGTESTAAAPLGLVICNPFGYEEICAHRSIRTFAERAAAAGVPTLRFDYDGAGDSAGGELDPERLQAWIKSVHYAADELRRLTGCERLCFLGIRLGVTLAALAASERSDVAGLVAIAPVVNAKAYTRELRALQMATRATAKETGDDSTEVTGFILSGETRSVLATVDLHKRERAPAPNILIIDRHDLPGNERWEQHLRSTGAVVAREVLPGYTEMMLSPHSAVVPDAIVARSVEWVAQQKLAGAAAPQPARAAEPPQTSVELAGASGTAQVRETALFLDAEQILFGILTEPVLPAAAGAQAILLLNAGGTHHIGPNRLYVTLARRWAALGHTVLRLDISGIGDSLPRPGEAENVIYTPHAARDIEQGVEFLRTRGQERELSAVGLCSGAYHAFRAAHAGVPLNTIVMINPLTFFWKEGMSLDEPMTDQRVISETQRYQRTLWNAESWLKLLRGDVNVIRIARIYLRRLVSMLAHAWRDIARRLSLPLQDDLGRDLEAIARQQVHMRFVFAEQDPGIELLRTQGGSSVKRLRGRNQLQIEVIGDADHTFTAHRARGELVSALSSALESGFRHD